MIYKNKKCFFIIIIILLINLFLNTQSVIDLYKKGKDAYFFEDYYTAIYYLKKSLELNPNYIDPILELAYLYYDIENYDYAYNYINKAIKLSTKADKLIIFSADIETELGIYNSAEKKYKLYDEDFLNNEFEISYHFLNPRIGINYNINSNLNTYLSISNTTREPRLKNFYDAAEASTPESWGAVIPQFELNEDSSYNYDKP